jgi:protein-tyrosine-phosphatase
MGLNLDPHRSRLVTSEMTAWAELSVVMDSRQARILRSEFGGVPERIAILGDLDPVVPDRRTIPDPLDRSEAFFRQTYERIDRCLIELYTLVTE